MTDPTTTGPSAPPRASTRKPRVIAGVVAVVGSLLAGYTLWTNTDDKGGPVAATSTTTEATADTTADTTSTTTAVIDAPPPTTPSAETQAAIDQWVEMADELTNQLSSAADIEAEYATIETAMYGALAEPEQAEELFALDALLDGQVLEPTVAVYSDGDAGASGFVGALASRPRAVGTEFALDRKADATDGDTSNVEVYFVNGVLNSSVDAALARDNLNRALGVPVHLVYNHSVLEPRDYTGHACAQALERAARFRAIPPDVLWNELTAMMTASPELLTDLERAAMSTCSAIERAGGAIINTGSRIVDLVRNNLQFAIQRVFDTDYASDSVNATLVDRMKRDIRAGKHVVIVGHSQGTLFLRNALAQINKWYAETYPDPCIDDEPALRTVRAAPVGALYISPVFGDRGTFFWNPENGNDRNAFGERYVMLEGDALTQGLPGLGLSPVQPTAAPEGGQDEGTNPFGLRTHLLSTYLQPGTTSRAQVIEAFGELQDWVRARSAPDAPCDPSGGSSGGSSGGATSTSASTAPGRTEYVVWYGANMPGIGVSITSREQFERRELARDYPDGGLDPELMLEKELLMDRSWSDYDEAVTDVCAKFIEVGWGRWSFQGQYVPDGKYYDLEIPCPIG